MLLAVLVAVWVICTVLNLPSLWRPQAQPFVGVRADTAGGYPVAIDVAPWEKSGIAPGDRLIRVGDADLRGMGQLAFYAHYLAESASPQPLAMIYERGGQRAVAIMRPGSTWRSPRDFTVPVGFRLVSLGFFVCGLLLALRASATPFVRTLGVALLFWAINTSVPLAGGVAVNYAGLAVIAVFTSLAHPLALRALLRFPSGAEPESAWLRYGPWLFAVMGPLTVNLFAGFPLRHPLGNALCQVTGLAFLVAILLGVARAYRRADALGRRQIRWVVLGFYVSLAPGVTLMALELVDRLLLGGGWLRFHPWVGPALQLSVLIPISILISVARYNLFDVDRLLSATAAYNILLFLAVGVGLVLVPWFGDLSSRLLGVDPRAGQVVLSLALAALVVPAQQRLRPRLDRVLFRERYALDQGIAELLSALAACGDARALTKQVGGELQRLLRPEACVVYARAGDAFAPVFVEGRAVPPAFEAGSPLVATLLAHRTPLALSDAGRRPDSATLGPFDRAALEALGAEVVVPVRQDDALLAFLCLAPRRSGDVYTSTDLSLLAALSDSVASQLRRFDQEQTLRQAQEMQESLRRYVPGAVAEELASGSDLGPSQREVSVLFADIRGYTSFAEKRGAEEIFSTVNRYTETVSSIVRAHGGSVVEFNGDGMMAVFGAPRDLPAKEQAAVEAGREIVEAVAGLPVAGSEEGNTRLSVGVGIATGEAFVGSVRAADRMIWTAIGNTTNLAARLQGLSRDLEAAVVIDAATWHALGPLRADFAHHEGIAIRGRAEPQDLYSLAMPSPKKTRAALR